MTAFHAMAVYTYISRHITEHTEGNSDNFRYYSEHGCDAKTMRKKLCGTRNLLLSFRGCVLID